MFNKPGKAKGKSKRLAFACRPRPLFRRAMHILVALSVAIPPSLTWAKENNGDSPATATKIHSLLTDGFPVLRIESDPQSVTFPDGHKETAVIETVIGTATNDAEVSELENTFSQILREDSKTGSPTSVIIGGAVGEQQDSARRILATQSSKSTTHVSTVEYPAGFLQGVRDFVKQIPGYRPTKHNLVITATRWLISGSAAFSSLLVTGIPPAAAGFVGYIGFGMLSGLTQYFTPILPWNQDNVERKAQWGLWAALEFGFVEMGRTAMVIMQHVFPYAHFAISGHLAALVSVAFGTATQGVWDFGTGKYYLNKRSEILSRSPLTRTDARRLHFAEVRRDLMAMLASAADIFLISGRTAGWHLANWGFLVFGVSGLVYTLFAYRVDVVKALRSLEEPMRKLLVRGDPSVANEKTTECVDALDIKPPQ